MYELSLRCLVCGRPKVIKVPKKGYKAWQIDHIPIQHAMPEVSADDREMLMSQICGECFDALYGPDCE